MLEQHLKTTDRPRQLKYTHPYLALHKHFSHPQEQPIKIPPCTTRHREPIPKHTQKHPNTIPKPIPTSHQQETSRYNNTPQKTTHIPHSIHITHQHTKHRPKGSYCCSLRVGCIVWRLLFLWWSLCLLLLFCSAICVCCVYVCACVGVGFGEVSMW